MGSAALHPAQATGIVPVDDGTVCAAATCGSQFIHACGLLSYFCDRLSANILNVSKLLCLFFFSSMVCIFCF